MGAFRPNGALYVLDHVPDRYASLIVGSARPDPGERQRLWSYRCRSPFLLFACHTAERILEK